MRSVLVRFVAPLLFLLCPLGAAGQVPTPLPEGEARKVREVVQAQLDAFQRDDGAAAFALATPGIRATFGDADTFMAMVKTSYAVVYRPKTVEFGAALLLEGMVVQPVRLTDDEGQAWLAVYPMEKQPGGEWRTAGCQLSRLAGTTT